MTTAAIPGTGRGLTYRDLDNTPDDGNRYEVIDGVLYVTPLPFTAHQRAVTRLVFLLAKHLESHPLGEVFISGTKVVLDEKTGVGPDLVYISNEKGSQLKEDGVHGAPDLVVKVLSSKPSLDRVVKFRKYAAAGVAHYWIVDAQAHTLEAYAFQDGRYAERARLVDDEKFEPELFPGLTIELGTLWS